jgi:hypothetical protein
MSAHLRAASLRVRKRDSASERVFHAIDVTTGSLGGSPN